MNNVSKGTCDISLVFDKSKATANDISSFVDSDYGGDLYQRSLSSYIFYSM